MAFVGWFPRFSPEGHYLAAGDVSITVAAVSVVAGQVVLTNPITVGSGIAPAWISNTPRTLFWWDRANHFKLAQEVVFAAMHVGNLEVQGHLGASGYGYDAGGGDWIGYNATENRLTHSSGLIIPGGAAPAMDQNGRYVYRVGDHQIVLSTDGVIRQAAIGVINPHISTQAVTWGEFVSPSRRETFGYRTGLGVQRVHASAGTEFWSIPIDTPEGPWILSDDSVRLYLRPWGNATVRVVGPGDTFFPHAVYSAALGGFLVAWSDAGGNLATAFVESDATGVTPGSPGSGGAGSPLPPSGAPAAGTLTAQRPARPSPQARVIYPHVDRIPDTHTQQSVKLLWDRIAALDRRIATDPRFGDLAGQIGALGTRLDTQVSELAANLAEPRETSLPGEGGTPPPGGGDPGDPGGGGSSGSCADSPGTGHYDPGGTLTEHRARLIVCGTGDEWAALRVPTPSLADRETNAETLLRRCIWHLQQGGYTSGRQRNPSTAISKDKLTVVIDGETRAFDIFIDFDNHQVTMGMAWTEVFPADLVADAGIPD